MNQKSMSILFYLNKAKTNQSGKCPIYCRITYLKTRKQFSTGEFVEPTNWNSKKQKIGAKGKEDVNIQLTIIKDSLNKIFLQLQLSQAEFNVVDIADGYFGKSMRKEFGLMEYFKRYLLKRETLIGIDIQYSTWKKFDYVYEQTGSFIKWKYNKSDIPLNKLKLSFLLDFEYYLKTELRQKQVTLNKSIQRLRKPVREAINDGFLDQDPFVAYKPGKVKKEVVFLSVDELKSLESHKFKQPRLSLVKDLFIFCCYTGLAYNEMVNLRKKDIVQGFDGNEWIRMKRCKTNRMISVPLLPKAQVILQKYNGGLDYALPKFSNQKINSYLKEIAGIVGINKSITHHMARKTFASTVLLYNDVPMEIVSELLGHSSIKITQEYYGKIVQKRLGEEMIRLGKKLG